MKGWGEGVEKEKTLKDVERQPFKKLIGTFLPDFKSVFLHRGIKLRRDDFEHITACLIPVQYVRQM